jgi:putative nucleotidyltransferase with HDIG domain
MTADEILNKVTNLPPAPITACKLLELLGRPSLNNMSEVVQAIEYDASLTARLLRACNSAFMSGRERVNTVEEAVLRLGYAEILQLVVALNAGSALCADLAGYGMDSNELWGHSVTSALAGQKFVEFLPKLGVNPSVAFTAGLLHDIGKVILNQLPFSRVQSMKKMIRSQQVSAIEAEVAVLGVNHAEVGAALLQRWKLPDSIVEAVAHHHEPPADQKATLAAVVSLADSCARFSDASENSAVSASNSRVIEACGLKPDVMQTVRNYIESESEKIRKFMSIRP